MGVVVFTKVRGLAKSQSPRTLGSLDFKTLLVLGPLQKILLPFIFRGSVPLLPKKCKSTRLIWVFTVLGIYKFAPTFACTAVRLACMGAA